MKKHFGPIVLGIIAMTLTAPAVNATTVLADENGDVATPSGEQADKSKAQTDLETSLAQLKAKISVNDLADTQIKTLENAYTKYSNEAQKATTDAERNEIISFIAYYLDSKSTINYTFDVPSGIIKGTDEKVALPNIQKQFTKPGTYPLYIGNNDVEFANNTDDKTARSINLTLDENGEFTIDPNYLDKDGNILLKSNLSKDSLTEEIKQAEDTMSTHFTSSDPEALKSVIAEMSKDLNTIEIPAEASYTDLSKVKEEIQNTISKYSTFVQYGNRGMAGIPVVKGASVSFQTEPGGNYLKLAFDKDGSNLTSAEFTDKDGNPIKVSENVNITTDLSDQKVTTDNEIGTNEPETPIVTPSTDDNNSSSNTTTDTNKKAISNYSSVFYALPNKNVHLYNENGELITNRGLSGNTDWKVDKKMTLNNEVYLRVATNEWVKLTDGLEVNLNNTVVNTLNDAHLYNAKGDLITNRGLAKNTAWRSDKTASINGQTMYRVATNEWVKASDIK